MLRIDKGLSEKQRYNILREVGYSATEARKFRRYGGEKFFEKVEKKDPDLYAKTFEKVYRKEERSGKKILPDRSYENVKQGVARYNYKEKYNYIIKIIENGKVKYVTYTTNQELTPEQLKEEVKEYVKTARRKYAKQGGKKGRKSTSKKKQDPIYFVESVEVKV